jgi:hypothetical protein
MRKSTIILFIDLMIVCWPLEIFVFVNLPWVYYAERNAAYAQFKNVPGIANVQVWGTDDITYEAHDVSFQLAGHPDAYFGFWISDDMTTGTDHLYLETLGPWHFRTKGHVKGNEFYGGTIDVGTGGNFGPLLPFKLKNVQDVIAHYDDLVKIFAAWPDVNHVGKLTGLKNDVTGRFDDTLEYYCEKGAANAPIPAAWLEELKQQQRGIDPRWRKSDG